VIARRHCDRVTSLEGFVACPDVRHGLVVIVCFVPVLLLDFDSWKVYLPMNSERRELEASDKCGRFSARVEPFGHTERALSRIARCERVFLFNGMKVGHA